MEMDKLNHFKRADALRGFTCTKKDSIRKALSSYDSARKGLTLSKKNNGQFCTRQWKIKIVDALKGYDKKL